MSEALIKLGMDESYESFQNVFLDFRLCSETGVYFFYGLE